MLKTPFEMPKEIRTKAKMLGLFIGELAPLGVIAVLTLTVFKDMVHGYFTVPFFIIIILLCVYLVVPSPYNPKKKNYHSIYLLLKRDKSYYHSIDVNVEANRQLYEAIQRENENILDAQKESIYHEKEKTKEELILRKHLDEGTDIQSLNVGIEKDEEIVQITPIIPRLERVDTEEPAPIAQMIEQIEEETEVNNGEEDVTLDSNEHVEEGGKAIKEIKTDLNREEHIEPITRHQRKRDIKKLKGKRIIYVAVSLLLVAFVFFVVINPINISFSKSESAALAEQEEKLVAALRNFSLKDYDKAMEYFQDVDYELLSDEDKDVMLLSYLFGGEPKQALAIEPTFDETVASYYKATHSMQEIRDLAKETDSAVFQFEVAVSDKDFETIVELRDHVKIKDNRDEIIVEAMLELEDFDGARDFATDVGNSELVDLVDKFEKEKKDKNKK